MRLDRVADMGWLDHVEVVAELDLVLPIRGGFQHARNEVVVALAVDDRDSEGCREQSFSSLEVDRAICFPNDCVGQSFELIVGYRVGVTVPQRHGLIVVEVLLAFGDRDGRRVDECPAGGRVLGGAQDGFCALDARAKVITGYDGWVSCSGSGRVEDDARFEVSEKLLDLVRVANVTFVLRCSFATVGIGIPTDDQDWASSRLFK